MFLKYVYHNRLKLSYLLERINYSKVHDYEHRNGNNTANYECSNVLCQYEKNSTTNLAGYYFSLLPFCT